eukprot:272695-Chlamydomonas_euryale.AAC.1
MPNAVDVSAAVRSEAGGCASAHTCYFSSAVSQLICPVVVRVCHVRFVMDKLCGGWALGVALT